MELHTSCASGGFIVVVVVGGGGGGGVIVDDFVLIGVLTEDGVDFSDVGSGGEMNGIEWRVKDDVILRRNDKSITHVKGLENISFLYAPLTRNSEE